MLESIPLGEELTVGANSIVFVECDLDFRLPDFIALRFNLQIRHVHRGLLLGTGPLVDPGYRGKTMHTSPQPHRRGLLHPTERWLDLD